MNTVKVYPKAEQLEHAFKSLQRCLANLHAYIHFIKKLYES